MNSNYYLTLLYKKSLELKKILSTIDENGYIYLTPLGFEKASSVYERHVIISKSLISFCKKN